MDFSENALNALHYTRMLFKKKPATFHMLHVYKELVSNSSDNEYDGEWLDVKTEEVTSELKELLHRIKKANANPRHSFNTASKSTSFIDAIKETVLLKEIDYIVMGTKGPKGAFETFLGNNVVTVTKKVNLPIIIVPRAYSIKKPSQIVFSTNFNRAFDKNELATLVFLAKSLGCKIEIVQIMRDESLNDFQKVNKEILKDLLKGIDFHFHKINVAFSETEAIKDFAMKTKSDMISLVNHRNNFFYRLTEENIVKKVTFNSPVPILLLPQLV